MLEVHVPEGVWRFKSSRPHHYYGLALDIRHDRAVFYTSLAEPKKRDNSTLRGADNRVSQTAPLDRIEGSLSHLFSNSEIDARQVQLL